MNFVIDRISSKETFFVKDFKGEEFKNCVVEDIMDEVYSGIHR